MTEEEKRYIKGEIAMLTLAIDQARNAKEKEMDKGNWEHFYYWCGRIEACTEMIDFLHDLTNREFCK